MAINQLETNLEAVTNTIEAMEKSPNPDKKLLEELKKEQEKILKDLNIH